MNNDKSIKYKIALAYLILIATTVFSGWYIFRQVENISLPKKNVATETNRIFILSDILTNVFASESTGRIAMLSAKSADIKKYHAIMDSIQTQISTFNSSVASPTITQKLDSIQLLLDKKTKSFNDIIAFRKKHMGSQNFDEAFQEIRKTKEEIDQNNTQVPDSLNKKDGFWTRMANVVNSSKKEERDKAKEELIKKTHEAKRDSFARAAENIFNRAVESESKLSQQIIKKEGQLILENKRITQKIRSLFAEVEQDVLQKSYQSIDRSKAIIDETANNLVWSGSISFFLVFILGIIVIRDLNQNFEYKRKLERLNLEMEDLIKQKTFFFASITHDIVSPLNTMVGFSNLLEKTLTDEKQKEYLQNITHSTQYIQNLVTDLVDFSKLEHNRLIIKKESFHFGELINTIVLPLENEAKKKNITLTAEVSEDVNRYIYTDPYRLRQILVNILTNAIKFTHQGGVSLKAAKKNNTIEIVITDTGIGIDQKFHNVIFNEFQQAHDGIEKVYGGTGLGLNITKRLVNILNGDIYFESELERGTTFSITLPYVEGEDSKVNELEVVYDNDRKLSNKTILVIDDDKLQLKLMYEIFKDKVKKTDLLDNGKQLHTYLENNQYDLIITDIQMPNYSGYSIINDIKKHEQYKNTPVIAFTGKTDLDENEYYKLGFNALLQKPINITKLMKMVHKILQINPLKNAPVLNMEKTDHPKIIGKDYDLSELLVFTQNDYKATGDILHAFISSAYQAMEELHKAAEISDYKEISQIAHRILPMFRQLKMHTQIPVLELLEREVATLSETILMSTLTELNISVSKTLEKLKKIELF